MATTKVTKTKVAKTPEASEPKTTKTRVLATGKRKEAVARVHLFSGQGNIRVNGRTFEDYFPIEPLRIMIRQPFAVTNLEGKFDVIANVRGGGTSGQAGAVRHGIARALVMADQSLRATLRKSGYITRDPRMKERKKYGQEGARRRFQFSKR